MRRLMILLVAGLAPAMVMLAGGAQAADTPTAAPVNPEFVEYLERVAAGAIEATTEEGYGLGAMPLPLDMSHTAGQAAAAAMGPGAPAGQPASYDLRTAVPAKLTPVRDQGACGSCWSFATYGSMESCLLTPETWDFSEMDLICAHGFDYAPCFGGQAWMSTAYLGRWDGPVTETCYPYVGAAGNNCTIPRPSCTVQKHIQEVDYIPDRADNTIKNAIINNGAVYTTFYWDPPYYNSTTSSYYYNGTIPLNHAVCIVGWDNNYPAANFNIVPPGNGAFIIRNSWGPLWGQAGYCYISYFDTNIGKDNALFRNAEPTTNYLRKYDYDPLGWVSSVGYGSTTAWGANIFAAVADEDLVAVTTYADSVSTSYEVYVYTNVTAAGPTSGTLATGYPQTGTWAMPGYQRINLTSSVALTTGQKFSIVLKLTTPGYVYPIPYEEPVAGYSSAATANAGESYISSDGAAWMDITTWTGHSNANVCIKGFTGEPTAAVKWSQLPDESEYGMDIRVDDSDDQERVLADDFECTETSLLTDVHLWGSWKNDDVGDILTIHLSIHSDDPVGSGGTNPDNEYSMPDKLLKEWDLDPTQFTISPYKTTLDGEWWWDPVTGDLVFPGDYNIWKIDIDLSGDPWLQRGTPDNPIIYWLDVSVKLNPDIDAQFGWKTRKYPEHFMDDAVWAVDDGTGQIDWNELRYPPGHELVDQSIDMAFELTFEEFTVWALEFSLDIGSDTELSDPYVDGDEGFDPGDVYLGGPFYAASPSYQPVTPPETDGGRDGFKDDAIIMFPNMAAGGDPWPDPPDPNVPPLTAVPVGDGDITDYKDYFDLDGHDQLDFSLEDYQPYMEEFDSPCIFEAKYLFISYDDDMATGWPQGPPLQADVPVIVPSPAGISSYGADPTWDELLGLTVAPGAPPIPYTVVAAPMGIADEKAVHPDLKPDPTVLEADDDDVDSLDITEYDPEQEPVPGQSTCRYWFFSADHEAHMGLDPGAIYQVDLTLPAPVLPIKVVDDDNSMGLPNLGLPESTDVDAFEFVWAQLAAGGANLLAVLFSVDEDDPLTLGDESGGLDPKMIYISFMNGVNQPLLTDHLADDIDALSNWCAEIMIPDTEPPAIEKAESMKWHQYAIGGPWFGIDVLDRTNNSDVETRQDGVTKLVVQFDEDIQGTGVGGAALTSDVLLSNGTVTGATIGPSDTLTIDMTGTPKLDASLGSIPLTVSFPGISDDVGLFVVDTVCIRMLEGDAYYQTGAFSYIDPSDMIVVRNQGAALVTSATFRYDINVDGYFDPSDMIRVRNAAGTWINGTCP